MENFRFSSDLTNSDAKEDFPAPEGDDIIINKPDDSKNFIPFWLILYSIFIILNKV